MIIDPVVCDNGNTLILYVGHTVPHTADALLGALVKALETEALDPAHDAAYREPTVLALPPSHQLASWNGARVFQGNFWNLSLVFRLYTRCPTAIGLLDALVKRNIDSKAYRAAIAQTEDLRQRRLASLRGEA